MEGRVPISRVGGDKEGRAPISVVGRMAMRVGRWEVCGCGQPAMLVGRVAAEIWPDLKRSDITICHIGAWPHCDVESVCVSFCLWVCGGVG